MDGTRLRVKGISVGQPRETNVGSVGVTGIYKNPVAGPVQFNTGGVEGDAVCDDSCHGGPDQAVYVYTEDDYAVWESSLGYKPEPGTFGENLTIAGVECGKLSIGDRLVFDQVTLEVTSPRIPCGTFAEKMGDPTFVKQFRNAARPGFYCRVITEGSLTEGDAGALKPLDGDERVNLLELFEDYYERGDDVVKLQRFLRAPLAVRTREKLETRLQEVQGARV